MSSVGRIAEAWGPQARMAAALARRRHHPQPLAEPVKPRSKPGTVAPGDIIGVMDATGDPGTPRFKVVSRDGDYVTFDMPDLPSGAKMAPRTLHKRHILTDPDGARVPLREAWSDASRAAAAEARKRKPKCEGGQCYSGAFDLLHTLGGDWKLAHGVAVGQGPIKGVRYGHAWVENDSTVIDPSAGAALPKDSYYKLGKIDEKLVHRYTPAEAQKQAMKTKHYGPWVEPPEGVAFS